MDFKSKEELQQMPQTEEEHLENQNLDYEDQEKQHPDAEVIVYRHLSFLKFYEKWTFVCVCWKKINQI